MMKTNNHTQIRRRAMRKNTSIFAILIVASILLGACAPAVAAPAATQPPQMVEVTRIVAGTPEVVQVVVTATPGPKPTDLPAGSIQLTGAGATFPLPVYTEWIYAYQYVDPSVTINYNGIGSGGGKKAIVDNTVDFAGSDSVLADADYQKGVDLQMYPMLAGAVAPIYNIQGVTTTITLSRDTLASIYGATITKWNDPAIVALNPDLAAKLPAATITVVHRSDGSGTTEMFTNALSAFSADWKKNVGAGQSVQWPVDKAGNGVGGKGNQGVAAAVQNTPNSIGYVELNYAVANKILYANMVNKAGKTVTANAASLASAINDFKTAFNDKLTAVIVDGPSDASWPIVGYTYIILHTQNMKDCVKAQKLVSFINWALTDPAAAKRAADLGYSALPDAIRATVLDTLGKVTCSGQPVMTK
jgi:phosphate transport system substrate-binding protein